MQDSRIQFQSTLPWFCFSFVCICFCSLRIDRFIIVHAAWLESRILSILVFIYIIFQFPSSQLKCFSKLYISLFFLVHSLDPTSYYESLRIFIWRACSLLVVCARWHAKSYAIVVVLLLCFNSMTCLPSYQKAEFDHKIDKHCLAQCN